MKKVKVGIIGTGNIGTDLLVKVQRSEILECGIFTGNNKESKGIKKALSLEVRVSFESIKAIEEDPDCCDIVFDATSAKVHLTHAPVLEQLGKYTIDLTPSQYGKMCIPLINLDKSLGVKNINLVTCAGQAVIPIVHAIMKIHPCIPYVEIVSSIASKSAGPGTRANIDEFTQTTRDAIVSFCVVPKAKAIIILNPAEPPILMHNTVFAFLENPNIERINAAVMSVAKKIQEYVPGYRITLGPLAENKRLTVMTEVVGLGDFLPSYSGNLDIITCAAVKVAEEYAKRKILFGRR